MNIEEYKARKDKFRNDLQLLLNEFSNDVGFCVTDIDVDVEVFSSVGEKTFSLVTCKIKT